VRNPHIITSSLSPNRPSGHRLGPAATAQLQSHGRRSNATRPNHLPKRAERAERNRRNRQRQGASPKDSSTRVNTTTVPEQAQREATHARHRDVTRGRHDQYACRSRIALRSVGVLPARTPVSLAAIHPRLLVSWSRGERCYTAATSTIGARRSTPSNSTGRSVNDRTVGGR